MSSNPPDPVTAARRRPARLALRAGAALALVVVAAIAVSAPAGAQSGTGGSSGDPAATPTTFPPVENCGPGHIVRRPDCGIPPKSPTDPGGWLQVTLFYLICAAVAGIVGFVAWRAKVARRERAAAGRDPLTLARASGQGVRRSTRRDPVADTSSKIPEAKAGT